MQISTMSLSQLEVVLGWARDEGWNPGLDDAAAFLAADPHGFFLGQVSGKPAAAISVVNHDDAQAFLGLYICRPEFRGQGHGLALWSAALQHAGDRAIGLEGVPAQQENYVRSGFDRHGQTVRCAGMPMSRSGLCRVAADADVAALVVLDSAAVGYQRKAFADVWFQPRPTRRTMILERDGEIQGFATFRACHDGTKVGPFYAQTEADAQALLSTRPEGCGSGQLFIDVPDGTALHALVTGAGYTPVFETATMIKGSPAIGRAPLYCSLATLELG